MGAIRISNAIYQHTNGCVPSQAQLVISKKRSGTYTKAISENTMKQIIQLLQGTNHVPSTILICMLRNVFPPSVPITSQDLVKIRLKAKQMLKQNHTALTMSDTIMMKSNKVDFSSPSLDNDASSFIDAATLNAREIMQEALSSPDQRWKVQIYLEKLAQKDEGFTYHM